MRCIKECMILNWSNTSQDETTKQIWYMWKTVACRERCGVGSETLCYLWSGIPVPYKLNFKIYLDKHISLTHLFSCGVFDGDFPPHCMAFSHAFIISYSVRLTPKIWTHVQAQGLCWPFGSILFHCNLPTGIIPQGFVSSWQLVRGCFLLNQAFCLVLFFARSQADTFLYRSHWLI